ncbi:uncharacterized protein N7498_010277 [Penicillium cinerascens]|uniref:Uncharacterized protein n=1 Tax=Penicillium cinerascens TaxID=70096 RepID=A0A9W9J847_9EURO|nr:uncharacterized protein N7498_010277 [Penicillium cinerascens]KAJ5191292.1 hypothetical protein N7498_010277 [Penicillium cinerascens]
MNAPEHDTDGPPPYSARDPYLTAVSSTITNANGARLTAIPTSYHIHRGLFGGYKILKDDSAQEFRVKVHKVRLPDMVVLRETSLLTGAEVAHVKFLEQSNGCDIGIFRQPGVKGSIDWTRIAGDRRMSAVVPRLDANGAVIANTSVRRTFIWKGISTMTLEDEKSGMLAATVQEVANLQSLIAVVEIGVPFGEPFLILVLTAYLALYEKLRMIDKVPVGYDVGRHVIGGHVIGGHATGGHATGAHAFQANFAGAVGFAGTGGFAGGSFGGGGA